MFFMPFMFTPLATEETQCEMEGNIQHFAQA